VSTWYSDIPSISKRSKRIIEENMAKIKVTQIKSQIDKSRKQKDTIKALGLGKINKSNVLESNPQMKGC
jgi:large subunit ribosomal protein L30